MQSLSNPTSVPSNLQKVLDFLVDGGFDEAVRGVDYVPHLASPTLRPDFAVGVKKNMIDPALKGTVGMLQSAAKSKSVKRIVITSSLVVLATNPGASMPGTDDLAPVPDADKAAQNFMASKQPTFDLVTILPSYAQGRNELVTAEEDVHDGSNDVMVDLVLGANFGLPRQASTVFADDVAKVEVLALDPKLAKNGDNFIAAGSSSGRSIEWNEVTELTRKLFPNKSIPASYDVSNMEETFLTLGFAGLEMQVKSLIWPYVELASK